MPWDKTSVEAELAHRSLTYESREIDYAHQFKLNTGETVTAYDTGKVVVGGKKTALRDELNAKFNGLQPVVDEAPAGRSVFVVYGHDDEERARLEAMLRRWGIEPMILDQEPASGLTIIEKLDAKSVGVSYAIVLMTGDDIGQEKGQPESSARPRARQNVVLELGMFLGRLGRARVAILYERGVELPSDIAGLEYIGYTEHVEEKRLELAKAMANAGIAIDLAKV